MYADLAIRKLLDEGDFQTVLDIGSGAGDHTTEFWKHGKDVTACDFLHRVKHDGVTYLTGDFMVQPFNGAHGYDVIWASHVLEHQLNPHDFLRKCILLMGAGGYIVITVPPLKHEIVGGHVSLWNAGLVLYHLVLAGLDCRKAHVRQYGYNVSVIVKATHFIPFPQGLKFDYGDILKIRRWLPEDLPWSSPNVQGDTPFNGDIHDFHWEDHL